MILSAIAVITLLVFSALTSGTETAMTGASKARLHFLANEGNRRAASVKNLLDDKERLIGALLLGNNAFNILAAALATDLFLKLTGEAGVVYASLTMTLMVVIFAEVLPKTYAIRNPETLSLFIAPVVRMLVIITSPVTRLVELIVNGVLRLFGAETSKTPLMPAAELLRGAIELHREEGRMGKQERDMLGGILDLADVDVDEVMTHRRDMVTIDESLPNAEILRIIETNPFTRYPVWRDDPDSVVGILHAKDVLLAARRMTDEEFARIDTAKLIAKPWFIPDTTSLRHQLLAFRQKRSHMALVGDEYGSLMGLVTLEDIIEEIVGDIVDEKDVEVSGIQSLPDGSVIAEGKVTVRDLNRQFDWRLPDEDATTIAGLIINEAQRIPDVGQSFSFYGFRFDVLRRHRHQITRIKVTPPADQIKAA
ncbi:MAG: HlyC/CorC family transporter [Geminicoccaceae bacterium]